jgi:response regulator RpfG family c-di-GMP phosphodiesterase
LEQYRLITAERDLLDKTLISSIQLLVEILSIINPPAFGRASRVCRIVQKLCAELAVENSWEISVAAMLSQLGCVSLPDGVLEKLQRGEKLNAEDTTLYQSHPRLGHDLIAKIPRLERVAQMIALQQQPFEIEQMQGQDPQHREILTRAGFLKVALDYDALLEQGQCPEEALREMLGRCGSYEPRVLRSLADIVLETAEEDVRQISLVELREGMVLAAHLTDASGAVLVAKGQVVTTWLLERLRHRCTVSSRAIREPICVLVPEFRVAPANPNSPLNPAPLPVTV